MRLRRLDLERYGRFTNRSFDFGERGDGPDLHVVYGPNEAGKSTLFNGFLDLLYGVPGQSPYGFLHPYPTMRIAAALDVGGAEREVVRIKKPANSLLDPTGRALPEAVLSSALGGIGRDAYRAMFSLDDDSLEGGGKAILDSRGDLGELLFSASAGLADLSRRLVDVRAAADGFYRYRAHSGGLQDLKARLAALKAEREAIDMGALEYVRLVEIRDAASARYAEAVAERGSHQARLEAIGARLGALPRLGALRELRARLSSLAHLPDPPPHWPEAAPLLAREAVELAASAAGIDAELARLAEEEAAIVLDEPVLAAEHRLAAIAALRPRAETAGQDLPRSRLAIREEEAAVAALLARIGRPGESDPQRLLLPIRTVSALRNAIEARSGVVAAFEAARTALSQAEAGLDDARGRLAERGGDPRQDGEGRDVAIVALEAAVRAARVSDHASRARTAGRTVTEARAELERRCAAMRFVGDPLDLRSAPIPAPDAVAAWKVHEASLDAEDSRLDAEALRLKAEVLRLEGERVLLDHAGALSSETEVARARKDRERAWAEHRTSLAAATADAFEAAMRRDDLVASARVADAADRARLRQVEESIARSAAALSSQGPEGERQLARRARHAAAISDAWSRAGVVDPIPETGAVALETWLARRTEVLDALAALDAAVRQGLEADEDGLAATSALRGALVRAGVHAEGADDLDLLLARSRARLDGEAEARTLRDAVCEREKEHRDRLRTFEEASRAQRGWTESWASACSTCFLGEDGGPLAIDVVRDVLAELAVLGPALERCAGWTDRIGKMERDVAAFEREVEAIAGLVGAPPERAGHLVLVDGLAARLAVAVEARSALARLRTAREEAEGRRRLLAEQVDLNGRRRREMADLFGVADGNGVEAALAGIADRVRIEEEARKVGREILDLLGLDDLSGAEVELDGADRDALARERAELRLRLDDEDMRCHELYAAMGAATDRVQAIGGDARVVSIESRRRTVLLEIEDGALRYLRLRAGLAAMDQALRLYREGHRGSMLERASEAFVTMSGGAYSGLRTQPWKDRETLIAISRDGPSKEADQLSKGTRFQLYLSLRAAGYLEYAGIRTPPPFIADDIMETFDDFRAEEALRIFAKMAEVGQVIYLTHHRHLLPIARDVCPGVTIHELVGPQRAAA